MDRNIFSVLYKRLKEKKSCVLIRIIQHEGSTPRGVGSCCLVDADGEVVGTIGGGLVEYRAIEKAKLLLADGLTSVSTFEMTSQEIEEDGMICGGRVKLFFETIRSEDTDAVEFFGTLERLLRKREPAVLVTLITDSVVVKTSKTRMLVTEQGQTYGTIPDFTAIKQVRHAEVISSTDGQISVLLEPIRQLPEIIIFGAGHVSTFVAPLAKMVGFQVRVIDDRREFANRKRFPEADDIYAMPYTDVFEQLEIGQDSYLVIVTRGHGMDKEVLELILDLDTEPAYVGMIGSLRKRDTIYKALIDSGTEQQTLAGVYSPIGLDIGAETPEEIAVSIIAEVIEVRAGRSSRSEFPVFSTYSSTSLRCIK